MKQALQQEWQEQEGMREPVFGGEWWQYVLLSGRQR